VNSVWKAIPDITNITEAEVKSLKQLIKFPYILHFVTVHVYCKIAQWMLWHGDCKVG